MDQTIQNQRKLKFTAFDALIAIVLIAMIAYVGYTIATKAASNIGTPVEVTCTAEIAVIDESTAKLMQKGDKITLAKRDIAVIDAIEIKPARKMVFDSLSGTYNFELYPNKVDVTLTLKASGLETDQDIKVGNTILRIGSNLNLKGKGYVGNSLILDVSATKKEVN